MTITARETRIRTVAPLSWRHRAVIAFVSVFASEGLSTSIVGVVTRPTVSVYDSCDRMLGVYRLSDDATTKSDRCSSHHEAGTRVNSRRTNRGSRSPRSCLLYTS